MSTIIKPVEGCKLGHIVLANNKYYYVDSRFVNPLAHSSYETMVFKADADGNVSDWMGVYTERYVTYPEMAYRHEYIINNLEEVL